MTHPLSSKPFVSDWVIFDQVLTEKNCPREKVIYPEKYMDQESVAQRRSAIREMRKRGISVSSLTALTPYTRQGIYDMLKNGQRDLE
jgi:hypothetical protein